MAIVRGLTTQAVANTFIQVAIDTNLTSDGKAAWAIRRFRAFFSGFYVQPAADMIAEAILSTQITTVTTMIDPEELARCSVAVANTAGVAVAFPLDLHQEAIILGERLTVQPTLYVGHSSAGLTTVGSVYWELEYDVIKLTDLEVLRLLVAGG